MAARLKVLQKKDLQETRLDAVRIIATHWRNQRKLYNAKQREQANESPPNSPAKSRESQCHIMIEDACKACSI